MADLETRRIKAAIGLRRTGDQASAHRQLTEIWEEISPAGNPIQLCAVAHHLADLQDDVDTELAWDLLALRAADKITDAHRAALPSTPTNTFYPSLHINLGEDYRKLGNLAKAREHLAQGRQALTQSGRLAGMGPDDEYGKLIRSGLERLAGLLARPTQEN